MEDINKPIEDDFKAKYVTANINAYEGKSDNCVLLVGKELVVGIEDEGELVVRFDPHAMQDIKDHGFEGEDVIQFLSDRFHCMALWSDHGDRLVAELS